MRTFETDINGDFVVNAQGNLSIITDASAVAQTSREFAASRLTEMVHNADEGIPFFETVFGASANIAQYEAFLRRRLRQAPEVLEVQALDVFFAEEIGPAGISETVLKYTATLLTTYGEVPISG